MNDTTTEDRYQLERLVYDLHRVLDDPESHTAQGFGTIYAPDATLRSPRGEAAGIEQITAYVRDHANPDERTRHDALGVVVDRHTDAATATVTANVLTHYFRDRTLLRTAALRYTLEAVRTSAGWRVGHADISLDWLQPVAA